MSENKCKNLYEKTYSMYLYTYILYLLETNSKSTTSKQITMNFFHILALISIKDICYPNKNYLFYATKRRFSILLVISICYPVYRYMEQNCFLLHLIAHCQCAN